MKKYLIRLAVGLLTFTIGATISGISHRFRRPAPWQNVRAQADGVQEPASTNAEVDQQMPRSLSPYDIKFFINDRPRVNLTRLWEVLGIYADHSIEQETNGLDFFTDCGSCQAEDFEYNLDGEPGNEVLLRIGRVEAVARYLIFRWQADGWKLIGHIDALGKYREPQHTIVLSGGLTWLTIQSQGATGSGVATFVDRVFLVRDGRLVEAFRYLSDGSQSGGSRSGTSYEADREFNASVRSCTLTGDVVTAEIDYSVRYTIADFHNPAENIILFAKHQRATITKRLGRHEQFDRKRSSLSERELDAVYNIDSLSDEDFLKYNYKELTQIAAGRDLTRKEWLTQFLKTCENTIERRGLSQVLAQ